MALAGKDANVKIVSAVGTTVAGQALSLVVGTSAEYVVTDASRRHFDRDVAPAVYNNSTLAAPTTYTVNAVQGRILFASTQTGPVTADLTWLSASQVAGGREWSLDVQQDLFEVSQFGSSGWKQFQSNLVGATIQIGRYHQETETDFLDNMILDQAVLVELLPSSTDVGRYEGYAYVSQDQADAAVDGIVGETVTLNVDGRLYWTTQ